MVLRVQYKYIQITIALTSFNRIRILIYQGLRANSTARYVPLTPSPRKGEDPSHVKKVT